MTQLINYNNYLRPTGELPKHISFLQYQAIREKIPEYYKKLKMPNNRNKFLTLRDVLLIDFLWASGGRIGDVINITKDNINFEEKTVFLAIKKSKKTLTINIDDDLMYRLSRFFNIFPKIIKPFDITGVAAWYICRKFGKMIDLKLHPHMFRHGLGLYLMGQNVPIPIITYRLCHSSTKITMDLYLKVTPEIEKQLIMNDNIKWR